MPETSAVAARSHRGLGHHRDRDRAASSVRAPQCRAAWSVARGDAQRECQPDHLPKAPGSEEPVEDLSLGTMLTLCTSAQKPHPCLCSCRETQGKRRLAGAVAAREEWQEGARGDAAPAKSWWHLRAARGCERWPLSSSWRRRWGDAAGQCSPAPGSTPTACQQIPPAAEGDLRVRQDAADCSWRLWMLEPSLP